MRELFRKYREIILYVFFGGCTTLVNIVVYYAMTRFLGVGEYASNVTAWILSVLFAYVTNKIWVFECRSRDAKVLLRQMGSFFGCRLRSLGMDR
ncbi:MAG: GtrA family protein, partial [Clostridiales bacterium]|nr:GtrA family protein [Clostridiales bacterium]